MSEELEELLRCFEETVVSQRFVSLVLARPRKNATEQPRKQTIRPVLIKNEARLQWEQQFERQQTQVNRTLLESADLIRNLFDTVYQEAYLFTGDVDYVAKVSSQGRVHLQRKKPSQLPQATLAHNRKKEYLIPEGVPCPFLYELDVMTAEGVVKPSRQKKFRQINRYLEMVHDIVDALPASGKLRIVDFGCGLSYLTFALHHLFHFILKRDVELIGIDQNRHVIDRCQSIASKLKLTGMVFQSEQIQSVTESDVSESGTIDLAVSLHACDTATDHALAFSVSAGAKVILAAPCCQHELSQSIESEPLEGILRYGVLKERVSALATDALRAGALEAAGYRTQILEFIDLEHTPKNLLIRAVLRDQPAADAVDRYVGLKQFLGVNKLATDAILDAARPRKVAESGDLPV
ncbi:class I SAM-dependent methyltransferase [Planctomicrobium sp. SH527]|uniref:class I SAM-dependent methyltransferase n=1 Tax=Planctomicrobium sp. SH527 TaxID=3448123 RepID=UPI003F5BFA67